MQLPAFDAVHVLVVGDLMLDRYWQGETSRISPEAPVPVVHVGSIEERPGGAGNVALNIAALGARATVLGLTGDDEAAGGLEQCLTAAGVNCGFERLAGVTTVTKLRVLSRHQQLIRLDFEDGFKGHDVTSLTRRCRSDLQQADVLILSDYGKGTLSAPQALIEAARSLGKPVLVDPKGTDFSRYRGAMVITPNFHEFEVVVGRCADEAALAEKGAKLMQAFDIKALLITRGEHGMTLLQAGRSALHLPAQAREVFDVTGAGDTVISALAVGLAAGQGLEQAVALSNLAAGIVVAKLGTASVSLPELQRALHTNQASGGSVLSEQQLLAAREIAHSRGERVVMTNGCFDILHAGHVNYLEQARQLGDRLIVAINDDASVRTLKGEDRPINNLACRMAVLAALGCVDWVVPFSEQTPERLIRRIEPDVLVKGGDYQVHEIAGADSVLSRGGKVHILKFVDGCSTSRIIESIRDGNP